jgi:hypothetical protein
MKRLCRSAILVLIPLWFFSTFLISSATSTTDLLRGKAKFAGLHFISATSEYWKYLYLQSTLRDDIGEELGRLLLPSPLAMHGRT